MSTESKKRKIIRRSITIFLSLLVLVFVICVSYVGYTYIKTHGITLKSEEQIKTDADILDADMSYLLSGYNIAKKTLRLGHNGGEPIKVVLSGKLHEITKETVKTVYYEIINPLMSRINANYVFEVVEEKDFVKTKSDRVIIRVKSENKSGIVVRDGSVHFTWTHLWVNPTITGLKIVINEHGFEQDEITVRLKYTIIHEILHTLGLSDVYDVENYSTMLKHTYYSSEFPVIKPNDIKALAALYFEDFENLEALRTWISDYTDGYYQKFGELFAGKKEIANFNVVEDYGGFQISEEVEPTMIIDIDSPITEIFTGISEREGTSYTFELKGNTFTYRLVETATGSILEESSGICYLVGGKLFFGILNVICGGEICQIEVAIVNTQEGYILIGIPWSFGYINDEKVILSPNR